MYCNDRDFLEICKSGTPDQIEKLLINGCHINNNGYNVNLFSNIIMRSDINVEECRRFLKYRPIIDITLFDKCLKSNFDTKAKFLLENNGCNYKDIFYTRAFYVSLFNHKYEIADYLTKNKTNLIFDINDVYSKYMSGKILVDLDVDENKSYYLNKIISALPLELLELKYHGIGTFLHHLIRNRYHKNVRDDPSSLNNIKLLLIRGVRVEEISFIEICRNGDNELFNLLINIVDDKIINPPSGNETSPLLEAVLFCHFDIIDSLLQKDANVNFYNHSGLSVLMAVLNGGYLNTTKFKIIELLFNYNVDLNQPNIYGETILFHINDISLLSNLVLHGANINHQDNNGHTVLYHAVGLLRHDLVKTILIFNPSILEIRKLLENLPSYIPMFGYKIQGPKYIFDSTLSIDQKDCLKQYSEMIIREDLKNYGIYR